MHGSRIFERLAVLASNRSINKLKGQIVITENLKAIKRWARPDHYAGASWPEYFVFLGQHRDSDSVTRSNFEVGLRELGGESDTVFIVRERHWAVGWVEWIAVHESNEAAIEAADEMLCAIEDYPVLSDDHHSELEWNEVTDYWERMGIRERVDYCRDAGISIFAARRDYLPEDPSGYLFEQLRG